MVGQLAYSLMPWRISGSSSTLTVNSFSTPQAFRIWTALAEKPHCGNCGVPFIYRTTGLPVTCCLMRSCASMLSPQIPDKTRRKLYRPLKTRSTAPHARARARQSREVVEIGHLGVTQRDEELDAAISLVVTVLHEQRTARPEPVLRTRCNLPDAGQPVLSADQGKSRLEAQVAAFQMSVSRCDVGRIRDDQIELLRTERNEPVAQHKVDFSPAVARVSPSESEGRFGNVRGDDPKPRPFAREGDGNRSAARSEFQHASRRTGGKALECELDQVLRFGSRDQHVRSHAQRQPVEFPPAGNVGNGFARASPGEPSVRSTRPGRIDRFFAMGDEPDALAAQNGAKQQLRFESRQSGFAQQAAYRCAGFDRVHSGIRFSAHRRTRRAARSGARRAAPESAGSDRRP